MLGVGAVMAPCVPEFRVAPSRRPEFRVAPPRRPDKGGTAISEELVIRFFTALEAGDIDTLREIYAPDAVIWHNDDLIEQPVEDNLKVLRGLHRVVSGLHYDITRRVPAPDGVLQQHVLRGQLPDGSDVELHAAMYLQVRDGRITRIEEYLDSGKRATIKAAREALSG